ncbi:hypothetical protein G7046_g4758 [Stylonectria norvegica]|nr:hypothetical protein G7046_g4758 [Stylonectria norvegica]
MDFNTQGQAQLPPRRPRPNSAHPHNPPPARAPVPGPNLHPPSHAGPVREETGPPPVFEEVRNRRNRLLFVLGSQRLHFWDPVRPEEHLNQFTRRRSRIPSNPPNTPQPHTSIPELFGRPPLLRELSSGNYPSLARLRPADRVRQWVDDDSPDDLTSPRLTPQQSFRTPFQMPAEPFEGPLWPPSSLGLPSPMIPVAEHIAQGPVFARIQTIPYVHEPDLDDTDEFFRPPALRTPSPPPLRLGSPVSPVEQPVLSPQILPDGAEFESSVWRDDYARRLRAARRERERAWELEPPEQAEEPTREIRVPQQTDQPAPWAWSWLFRTQVGFWVRFVLVACVQFMYSLQWTLGTGKLSGLR